MSVFRKYDVRGAYPSDIDEEKAKKIAKAFAEVKNLHGGTIAVGKDVRESSPKVSEAVIKGLLEQGCDVIDIGTVATPMVYYTVVEYNLAGGAMVTASHNPPGDNGIRFCEEMGMDLTYESGISQMEKVYDRGFENRSYGKVSTEDVIPGFVKKVSSSVNLSEKPKIVIDPGNGSASLFARDIFERMGCEVVEINSEADGSFPARGPDPVENIGTVGDVVVDKRADLGVAFDGDGDRGTFVDERGERVDNDVVLTLFVKNLMEKGDVVLHDVKSSKLVEDMAEELGVVNVPFRVGMSYIKREMIKREADVGGEYTGHFFFKENGYYDDPYYATGRLLEIMDREGSLSDLVDELPTYHSSPEFRIKCKNKEEIPKQLKEEFSDRKIVGKDGAKIYFRGGWALVRPSGTEDKISIRFEADTEKRLEEIKSNVMEKTKEYIEV